ncbi:MAG: hypothetical protein AAFN59_11720 [Pseudomonadota bacterium]
MVKALKTRMHQAPSNLVQDFAGGAALVVIILGSLYLPMFA